MVRRNVSQCFSLYLELQYLCTKRLVVCLHVCLSTLNEPLGNIVGDFLPVNRVRFVK